ncbi:hypothetical protein [Rhizobium sp. C4]|uniref:hypothetical protein n=1 Tax=Rhizobium sp. C4 TaxID=1349800 RepID=UPI001E6553B7|nr:hypothetical protein [Rhizobium sp. C4]MCD2172850.1 hypothetical protein [Rhizobium sp. C4]
MKTGLAAVIAFLLAAVPAAAVEPELYRGERLVNLTLPDDGHLTKAGWTRGGKAVAYRLKVPAGAEMTINMTASASRFTYLVIFDLNDPNPEDALYSSDSRRLPAHIFADAEKDMDLLIRPFFAKQAPRRGLGSHFVLEIKRTK